MEEIVKQHSICLSEVFPSEQALSAHEAECAKYRTEFDLIKKAMWDHDALAVGGFGSFVPYQQWVRLDALSREDWPNGISGNSIFVDIKINMKEHKFEISRSGHIWLTEHDKKASYLCMCGMRNAVEAMGGKWMRKSKYKDATDLAKKVSAFWEQCMDCVNRATGGYPYKQMQVNIY